MTQTESPQSNNDQGFFPSLKYSLIGAVFICAVVGALYGIGFLVYGFDLAFKEQFSTPANAIDVNPALLIILGSVFAAATVIVFTLCWAACEISGRGVMAFIRPENTPSDSHTHCIASTKDGMSGSVEEEKAP